MTFYSFMEFYPQFSPFSLGVVLPEYIKQANDRFEDFGEDAEEARRLLTAHRMTLYAATCLPEGTPATKALLADYGSVRRQRVSGKKVGEVSVNYAETSAASVISTGLADLKETIYGMQLLALLRQHGFGKYIP